MPHSADGEWFWNGREWIAARSPDRAWWWDGAAWVPAKAPWPVRFEYQATPWTRRLQLMVVGLTVLGLVVVAISFPALGNQIIQQSIDRAISSQPGPAPADAAQLHRMLSATMNAALASALVLSIGLYGVLFLGVWKLWRWVFWYFVVVGFLAVLAIPQDVLSALDLGPYRLPLAFIVPSALQALTWLALSIWMVVLYRRHGTWARRRVPVENGPGGALS